MIWIYPIEHTVLGLSPVERGVVHHAVALLKLPGLDLLTLPVSAELDLDAAGAQEGRRPVGRRPL